MYLTILRSRANKNPSDGSCQPLKAIDRTSKLFLSVGLLAAVCAFPNTPAASQSKSCFGRTVTIQAKPGLKTVGTSGNDVIRGTNGADVIDGRGGNDRICGLSGRDNIKGGKGSDKLNGGGGNDVLSGGGGRDRLLGGSGRDRMLGGGGEDTCLGGKGNNTLKGCELPAKTPDVGSIQLPVEIEAGGLLLRFTELSIAYESDLDELARFGYFSPTWLISSTVEARATAPEPDYGGDWSWKPFEVNSLAIQDKNGRLYRIFHPRGLDDRNPTSVSPTEFRPFFQKGEVPKDLDLASSSLVVFGRDFDRTTTRVAVPLDGTADQGPRDVNLVISGDPYVRSSFGNSGQLELTGAQISRTAGEYIVGSADYNDVGQYRTRGFTNDPPVGAMMLHLQLAYEYIEYPGVDPGSFSASLDIEVDGVRLPDIQYWSSPSTRRGLGVETDEVSYLIPTTAHEVVVLAGGDVEFATIIIDAVPEQWTKTSVGGRTTENGALRLWAGDAFCARADLQEINSAVSADATFIYTSAGTTWGLGPSWDYSGEDWTVECEMRFIKNAGWDKVTIRVGDSRFRGTDCWDLCGETTESTRSVKVADGVYAEARKTGGPNGFINNAQVDELLQVLQSSALEG